MSTVKQLLDFKGHEVIAIEPGATVYAAVEKLAERRIGALPVLEPGRLIGIVTIGDGVRQLMADRDFTITQLEQYIFQG
jgi:CBS domain-containing protein